jgi:hypothetical protein
MASKRNKEPDIQASSVNWLEQLAAEVNLPFAPQGWFTMSQICEKVGRDHQVVRKLLKSRGAEAKQFRHTNNKGHTIITMHYKL